MIKLSSSKHCNFSTKNDRNKIKKYDCPKIQDLEYAYILLY